MEICADISNLTECTWRGIWPLSFIICGMTKSNETWNEWFKTWPSSCRYLIFFKGVSLFCYRGYYYFCCRGLSELTWRWVMHLYLGFLSFFGVTTKQQSLCTRSKLLETGSRHCAKSANYKQEIVTEMTQGFQYFIKEIIKKVKFE